MGAGDGGWGWGGEHWLERRFWILGHKNSGNSGNHVSSRSLARGHLRFGWDYGGGLLTCIGETLQ